jgi:anaerobic selenocysteine-containing dehydrogenase
MRETKSVCRYCVGACGMVAKLDDHGRIVSLRADHDHPLTAGFVCFKGLQSPAAMYSPDRISRAC